MYLRVLASGRGPDQLLLLVVLLIPAPLVHVTETGPAYLLASPVGWWGVDSNTTLSWCTCFLVRQCLAADAADAAGATMAVSAGTWSGRIPWGLVGFTHDCYARRSGLHGV